MDTQRSISDMSFPKIWIGYVTGGASVVLSMILIFLKPDQQSDFTPLTGFLAAVMLIALLTGVVYWFMSVHRLHEILLEATNQQYPISAGQATWLQLVPFYNIYWMFKWPAEAADFVNTTAGSKILGKYRYGWMLLAATIIGNIFNGAHLLIGFSILGHIGNGVQKALENKTLPVQTEQKEKYPTPKFLILFFLFVMIAGLLASIALPNFIRARDEALRKTQALNAQKTVLDPQATGSNQRAASK